MKGEGFMFKLSEKSITGEEGEEKEMKALRETSKSRGEKGESKGGSCAVWRGE